jgi:hypothetical protein
MVGKRDEERASQKLRAGFIRFGFLAHHGVNAILAGDLRKGL